MQTNVPTWENWLFGHSLFLILPFIALGGLTGYIIGQLSGWVLLSRRFRNGGAYYAYQWPFQSARLRTLFGNYNNCVNFGADEAGLYMAVFPLFRLGHAPLFIPWSEIQVVSGEQGLIFKYRKLLLGRLELIPLLVRMSLAEKLRQAAGQAWPVETIGA